MVNCEVPFRRLSPESLKNLWYGGQVDDGFSYCGRPRRDRASRSSTRIVHEFGVVGDDLEQPEAFGVKLSGVLTHQHPGEALHGPQGRLEVVGHGIRESSNSRLANSNSAVRCPKASSARLRSETSVTVPIQRTGFPSGDIAYFPELSTSGIRRLFFECGILQYRICPLQMCLNRSLHVVSISFGCTDSIQPSSVLGNSAGS